MVTGSALLGAMGGVWGKQRAQGEWLGQGMRMEGQTLHSPNQALLCLNCPEKTHSPWERFVSPDVSFSTALIDSFLYATALILTDL